MTKFATIAAFTMGLMLALPLSAHAHDVTATSQYGLVQRDFAKVDIAAITPEEATEIWKEKVWDALQCEALPDPIAAMVFHIGATQGTRAALRILEAAARQNGIKFTAAEGDQVPEKLVAGLAKSKAVDAIVLDMTGLALRRLAFTAGAATEMDIWAKQIIMLDRFVRDGGNEAASAPPPKLDKTGAAAA